MSAIWWDLLNGVNCKIGLELIMEWGEKLDQPKQKWHRGRTRRHEARVESTPTQNQAELTTESLCQQVAGNGLTDNMAVNQDTDWATVQFMA